MATILAFRPKIRAESPQAKQAHLSPSAQDPAHDLSTQIPVAVAHIDREIARLAARTNIHPA